MTLSIALRGLLRPLASAAVTALLFTGILVIQRARDGWPFAVSSTAPTSEAMPGMVPSTTAGAASGRVSIETAAARSLDLRLETVTRQPLAGTIRTVATVVPDESRISHIHTRVAGWVEHLEVATTGQVVREGEPFARIFSPELLASQTEYLTARRATAAAGISSAVIASGRTRLEVLGMTAAEIDAIERSGEPRRLVTVVAPHTGVLVNRGVTAGTSVDPSTTLATIADLSRVWILAEVPEASMASVRIGSAALVDFPASGRAPFTARVDFIYPMLTERTRTLRVRLSAANRDGALKPGLYGTAAFETAGHPVLTVPRDAVVDTGLQQHVFVAAGGRFEPRIVKVGIQLADRVEIREGLEDGEQVVAAGVFLLDSESRLRATGAGAHSHGLPSADEPSPSPTADPHAGHRPAATAAAGKE